jgi:hypothetical protein
MSHLIAVVFSVFGIVGLQTPPGHINVIFDQGILQPISLMCLHFPLSQFVIKPFGKGTEYPVPHSVCKVCSVSYAVGDSGGDGGGSACLVGGVYSVLIV